MCQAQRPGGSPKPSEVLRGAQRIANRIRKLLGAQASKGVSGTSRSTADAARLAQLIEVLAEKGQYVSAEEALVISEMVELLIERLLQEIDGFLAT